MDTYILFIHRNYLKLCTIIYGYIHILLMMYVYIAVSVTIVCL